MRLDDFRKHLVQEIAQSNKLKAILKDFDYSVNAIKSEDVYIQISLWGLDGNEGGVLTHLNFGEKLYLSACGNWDDYPHTFRQFNVVRYFSLCCFLKYDLNTLNEAAKCIDDIILESVKTFKEKA